MPTNVYQPDGAAGKDTGIFDGDDTYSDTDEPQVTCGVVEGEEKDIQKWRTLWGYDISDIPAGATILPGSKFELFLPYEATHNEGIFRGCRITQASWTETATWKYYDGVAGGHEWTTPGGDVEFKWLFDGPPPDYSDWLTVGEDALFIAFLQEALDDYGGDVPILLRKVTEDSEDWWDADTSDYGGGEGAFRPKLTVVYAVPWSQGQVIG